MFRNLIPALSDRYHVIAPDYPGHGYSSAPGVDECKYTFDHLADVVMRSPVNSASRATAST